MVSLVRLWYQLASPRWFIQCHRRYFKPFKYAAICFLCIALLWGLFFTPTDYQQSEAYRIMYVHVPAAFLSIAIFAAMGLAAFIYLIWKIKLSAIFMRAAAPFGFTLTVLALLTGSIWGKPMWGTYWIWDARLTSELILAFLYAIVLFLENSLAYHLRNKILCFFVLAGTLDLPVIHYSVEWWHTLHQGSTVMRVAQGSIHSTMFWPLMANLLAFSFCALVVVWSNAFTLLQREKYQ